jgi:hypothetical protein
MRALGYVARAETDYAKSAVDESRRKKHQKRTDLLTPIVKGWVTELSQELTYLAVQVHGGMGYIEETGVAQYYRDARILTIYEGTTGIQALDLVGRKTLADGGVAVDDLLNEIKADLDKIVEPDLQDIVQAVVESTAIAQQAKARVLAYGEKSDSAALGAASVNYMMLLGYLCGGWLLAKSASLALEQLSGESADDDFLQAKIVCARFFTEQLLPRTAALSAAIHAGGDSTMTLKEEQF